MKVIYIGFAFKHHRNSQGGYHHIKNFVKYDKIIDVQWEYDLMQISFRNIFFRIFRKTYIMIFGEGVPLNIIYCCFLAFFFKNRIFHFIYAENTYKWVHKFKNKSNKIICTFHQPFSSFENNNFYKEIFKNLDKIILVDNREIELFKLLTKKNNIFFIPHGINTNFYNLSNYYVKDSLLMVGNWLRDFKFAAEIFKRVNTLLPNIKIRIVTLKENFAFFKELDVELYNNITDLELRDFYRKSFLVFFPLLEFTANNALLEATASGSAVLIATKSDITNNSYFSKDFIEIVKMDHNFVLERIQYYFNNQDLFRHQRLINHVNNNYSWKIIGKKTQEVLVN